MTFIQVFESSFKEFEHFNDKICIDQGLFIGKSNYELCML